MPTHDWDRHRRDYTEAELRQAPAWVGVDLPMTTDPSSVSIVWATGGGRFYVRS